MVKRFLIALVLVVLVCGGLVGFNLFRAKMIGDFFANQQMPSVTVSATEIEPTTWTPQIEAIGTLLARAGRRRRGAGGGRREGDRVQRQRPGRGGRAAGADRRRGGARRPYLRRGDCGARPGAARARASGCARRGVSSEADARRGADRARRIAIGARAHPGRARPEGDRGALRRHDRHPADRCRPVSGARHGHRDAAAARHDAGRLHRAGAADERIAHGPAGRLRADGGGVSL